MAARTRITVVALAAAIVAATIVPGALAAQRTTVQEFKPVANSGLKGLGYVVKGGGKIRFLGTLRCSKACRTGVPGRFRLSHDRCGELTDKSFTLKASKLRSGGLYFDRTVAITPGNDLNAGSVSYEWDFDYGTQPASFRPAACANSRTIGKTAKPSVVTVVAWLAPVGDSGLVGLAYAHKDGSQFRFHATLACSHGCPAGATAAGVRGHFTFTHGKPGKPTGNAFSLDGGRLGAGGLDVVRKATVTDNNPVAMDPPNSLTYFWEYGDGSPPAARATETPSGWYYYYPTSNRR